MSVGTRGDIEPFLAIAELLKAKGHQVVCALPEQFSNLADDSHVRSISLGSAFTNLLESTDAKTAMGGKESALNKVGAYIRLYRQSSKINKDLLAQEENIVRQVSPDRVIYGGKAMYPIIWGIRNPKRSIRVSPVPCLIHFVRDHPNVGFHGNYGSFLNRITYSLANFAFVRSILSITKELRKFPKITGKDVKKAILTKKMIYAISPSIFPRPNYWPENARVLGFHERSKTLHWHPDDNLVRFLGRHEKVLLVTFGSMTNPEPAAKTKIILDILQQHRIPAVVNTAAGGVKEPIDYNAGLVHFVRDVPYDWILPRVYGVVHHGGSGTTHVALKYGCVSMIIPHIIDQYLWNDLLCSLGVGPKGIAINKITKENLEPKILDLIRNPSYKANALRLSGEMREENLRDELYKSIVE